MASEIANAVNLDDQMRMYARIAAIVEKMDASNVREVAKSFLDQSVGEPDYTGLSAILCTWAELDPLAAAEFAEGIARSDSRDFAFHDLFHTWAGRDYPAATRWASESLKSEDQAMAFSASLEAVAARNPEFALEEATRLDQRHPGLQLAESMVGTLTETSPEKASRYVQNLPRGNDRNYMLVSVAGSWADSDPEAALAWVDGFEESSTKREAITAVIDSAMRSDFDRGIQLIEELPRGEDRTQMLESAITLAAQNDPDAAFDLFEKISPQERRDEVLQSFAAEWARKDLETVRGWANSQSDPETRTVIWSGMVQTVAETDPPAAAALVDTLPPENRYDLAMNIIANWEDSVAALSWLQTSLTGDEKVDAMGSVLSDWVSVDAEGAMNWMSRTMGSGAERDGILEEFLVYLGDENPVVALQWAGTIQNQESQFGEIEQIIESWIERDPAAATQWIRDADLPPQQKETLLEYGEE